MLQIICSVHQPRYTIFALFDRVMVMSKGEVAYHGTAQDTLTAFTSLGWEYNNPHENVADYVVDCIVSAENDPDQTSRNEIIQSNLKRLKSISLKEQGADIQDAAASGFQKTSFLRQVQMLTGRSLKNTIRNPVFTAIQVCYCSISSFCLQIAFSPSFSSSRLCISDFFWGH